MNGGNKARNSSRKHGTVAELMDVDFTKEIKVDAKAYGHYVGVTLLSKLNLVLTPEQKTHAELALLSAFVVRMNDARSLGIQLNEYPCETCHAVLKALTRPGIARFDVIRVSLLEGTPRTYYYAHENEPGAVYRAPSIITYREGRAIYV